LILLCGGLTDAAKDQLKMAVMVAIMATDIYVKNALAKKGTALSWPQSRKYCTS